MLIRKMLRDLRLHAGQFLSATVILMLGLASFSGISAESHGLRVESEDFYRKTSLADVWLYDSNFNAHDLEELDKTGLFANVEPRLVVDGTSVQHERTTAVELYYLSANAVNKPLLKEGAPVDFTQDGLWLDARYAEANGLSSGDRLTFKAGGQEKTLPILGTVYSAEYVYRPSPSLDPDFKNKGFAFLSHRLAPTAKALADAQDARAKAAKAQETTPNADKGAAPAQGEVTVPEELTKKLPPDVLEKIPAAMLNDMIAGVPLKIIERTDAQTVTDLITREAIKRGIDLAPPAQQPAAAPLPKPDEQPFNQVVCRLSSGAVTEAAEKSEVDRRITDALGRDTTYILHRDAFPSYSMFESETKQHETAQRVFPWVFILVSILITVISMNRMVNAQRIQIGTLRALGFSRARVIMHYLGYGFWPALIGCLIGLALGPVVISPLFYTSMSYFYTLPHWTPVIDDMSYVLVVVVTLICTLAVLLTIRSALAVKPATSLRPHVTKSAQHIPFEGTRWFRSRGFIGQWNYRDAMRNPVRALMAMMGAMGCIMLLVAAVNMSVMVVDIQNMVFKTANAYETSLTLDESTTPTRAQEIADEVGGYAVQRSAIEIKDGIEKANSSLTVQDPQAPLRLVSLDQKGTLPLQTEGVAISRLLAKTHGLGVGDTVEWRLTGANTWTTSRIREIYYSPMFQGLVMSTDAFKELDEELDPTMVYTATPKADLPAQIAGVKSITSMEEEAYAFKKLMGSMSSFVFVIIAFALLLLFIVVYNTGLLMFTEMFTELATLRTLGFSIKTVRAIMTAQTLALSFIGCVIGAPLGFVLAQSMMQATEDMDMFVTPSFWQAFLAACIVMVVTYMIMLLFSRKIRRIDMVEALKGGE